MQEKKRRLAFLFFLFSCLFTGYACGDNGSIQLPEVTHASGVSVEEALYRRKSVRSFLDEPLELDDLSRLLWAGCGRKVDGLSGATRTTPSAGGLNPIEVYAVLGNVSGAAPGVYSYDWRNHAIRLVKGGDYRAAVAKTAVIGRFIAEAPAIIVITAVYGRTSVIYGDRGSTRYVHMEAGHSAQNICLEAVALDLGTVTIGAFDDRGLKEILESTKEEPLYIMPVGKARR